MRDYFYLGIAWGRWSVKMVGWSLGRAWDAIPGIRMSRAERKMWATASTLVQLGYLMADWLEGRIPSQPGYPGRQGPAQETLGLIRTLAALNRAGFVTKASQPAHGPIESDPGLWFRQRAAVEGWCDEATLEDLRTVFRRIPEVRVIANKVADDADLATEIPVTDVTVHEELPEDGWGSYCWFGDTLSYRQLGETWREVGVDMFEVLTESWHVAIVDTEWGNNDRLWPILSQYAQLAWLRRNGLLRRGKTACAVEEPVLILAIDEVADLFHPPVVEYTKLIEGARPGTFWHEQAERLHLQGRKQPELHEELPEQI